MTVRLPKTRQTPELIGAIEGAQLARLEHKGAASLARIEAQKYEDELVEASRQRLIQTVAGIIQAGGKKNDIRNLFETNNWNVVKQWWDLGIAYLEKKEQEPQKGEGK